MGRDHLFDLRHGDLSSGRAQAAEDGKQQETTGWDMKLQVSANLGEFLLVLQAACNTFPRWGVAGSNPVVRSHVGTPMIRALPSSAGLT